MINNIKRQAITERKAMIDFTNFIGVDVSKYKIDIFVSKIGEYK